MIRSRPNFLSRIAPPTAVLLITLATLEAYVRIFHVPQYTLTPPSGIVRVMVTPDDRAELLASLGWTALAAAGGFVASATIGILMALALSASKLVRRAIYPYTIFFQTVPIIAIAPLLVIYLGFGLLPVVVCAFVVSVFPVIVNALAGLLSTDPALADLFKLHGADSIQTMWKLRLPTALPSIFAGLRIASGLSVIGTIVAEFMVGKSVGSGVGLGVIISTGPQHPAEMAKVSTAVLLASLLGLGMFATVNLAGWLSLRRWHASEK